MNILQEMITVFKYPHIIDTPLMFQSVDEAGADADGVSREAYMAFWSEIYPCP